MTKRLPGAALPAPTRVLATALVVAVSLVAAVAVTLMTASTALAADEVLPGATEAQEEGLPELEEVVTDYARSEGFVPDEYASPSWFQWLLYPTIVIGALMVLGLLLYYLFRQPSFAEERKQKSRR